MIKKIGIAVVVLLGALLTYAATQPTRSGIQRAASIKAPPERILPCSTIFCAGILVALERKTPR